MDGSEYPLLSQNWGKLSYELEVIEDVKLRLLLKGFPHCMYTSKGSFIVNK